MSEAGKFHAVVATGVTEWLRRNLWQFSLPDDRDSDSEITEIDWKRKAWGELGVAYLLMRRRPAYRNCGLATEVGRHLVRDASQLWFDFDVQNRTVLFPFYLTAYIVLREAGINVQLLKHKIDMILSTALVDRIERTAWHNIDLQYYFSLADIKCAVPTFETLYESSSLHLLPDPAAVRTIDVYAITHIIFSICDFGERKELPSYLLPRRDDIREYVRVLLATYLIKRDWDLVAELIMCCDFLGVASGRLLDQAWSKLAKHQGADGMIYSRYYDYPKASTLTSTDLIMYDFKTNYHPTLVSLLAAIVWST